MEVNYSSKSLYVFTNGKFGLQQRKRENVR